MEELGFQVEFSLSNYNNQFFATGSVVLALLWLPMAVRMHIYAHMLTPVRGHTHTQVHLHMACSSFP